MNILKEISFIQIEQPGNLVTEIHGIEADSGTEVRLIASDYESPGYYLRHPKTNNNVFILKITIGDKSRPCFFANDEENTDTNLLLEMERQLTGEPK